MCADEWPAVADFIWNNRQHFTGVALLQDQGDKAYAQAPREAVTTLDDIVKWNSLTYEPVDYTLLREEEDLTELKQVVACAGGSLRAPCLNVGRNGRHVSDLSGWL